MLEAGPSARAASFDTLVFGFEGQTGSTIRGVAAGFWGVTIVDNEAPARPELRTPGAFRVLCVQGGVRVAFNHGAWPGRRVELFLGLSHLALVMTVMLLVYGGLRASFAIARRFRTRARLRRGACVVCGYPLAVAPGARR